MKKTLLIVAVLVIGLAASVSPALAQHKTKHAHRSSSKGTTSKGTPKWSGHDLPDKGTMPRPPKKGGAKAKGAKAIGLIHVNNMTDYNVYIYEDGGYVGEVGAWGDLYFDSYDGDHVLGAVSVGGTTTWGPREIWVDEGGYTWELDD